jgi:hypothetical protein
MITDALTDKADYFDSWTSLFSPHQEKAGNVDVEDAKRGPGRLVPGGWLVGQHWS